MEDFYKLAIAFLIIFFMNILVKNILNYQHNQLMSNIENGHKKRIEEIQKTFYDAQANSNNDVANSLEIIAEKYNQLQKEAFAGTIRNILIQLIEENENGSKDYALQFTYTMNGVEYSFELELLKK